MQSKGTQNRLFFKTSINIKAKHQNQNWNSSQPCFIQCLFQKRNNFFFIFDTTLIHSMYIYEFEFS